ncbi:caspase Dronc-like [Cochliomyia hominivorax]
MEKNQREKILNNIDKLIDYTDFEQLCEACCNDELLSSTMITNIKRTTPSNQSVGPKALYDDTLERERHKQLFIKITKRGPQAFQKLHRIFVRLKYEDALKILFNAHEDHSLRSTYNIGGYRSTNNDNQSSDGDKIVDKITGQLSINNNNNVTLQEYDARLIQPKKNIVVRSAKNITIHSKLGTYLMESKDKRGIFFLIRSDEHQEFDDDDHLLLSLFQKLSFKIYAYNNITFQVFTKLLVELLGSDKIKDIECFILFIRTKGKLHNNMQRMKFNDGSIVKIEQVHKYFYNNNCPQLLGRPKIFIFPYKEIHKRRVQTDGLGEVLRSPHVPQMSDVINCYVANNGYMDDRDNNNFSCYIQNFVDVISERACDTSLDDMLKIIHTKVAEQSAISGQLQESSYENISQNKMLYLNPGISN